MAVHYTDADAVRARLAVDDTVLPDAAADELIRHAETLIDSVMGPLGVDAATGRKVVETVADPWRWACLSEATELVAAGLYSEPDRYDTGRVYDTQSGPDFSLSGRVSGGDLETLLGSRVMALLNHSGLRLLTVYMGRRPAPSESRW